MSGSFHTCNCSIYIYILYSFEGPLSILTIKVYISLYGTTYAYVRTLPAKCEHYSPYVVCVRTRHRHNLDSYNENSHLTGTNMCCSELNLAILNMQTSQISIICLCNPSRQTYRKMRAVQSKLRSVERSQKNNGHFGSHIEYAKEPNLHIFLGDPHRYI